MGDFLGTGRIASHLVKFRSFKAARKFVRSLKLKNANEWKKYCQSEKKPSDIPKNLIGTYKNNKNWLGVGHFIGYGKVASHLIQYRSFKAARKFVRSLKLKTQNEWINFARSKKRPVDIPADPKNFYINKGWISMGDFLGTSRISFNLIRYRPFKEARKFARSLKLKSGSEWDNFCKNKKLPTDIPAKPDNTYKNKGWKGMVDFLDSDYRAFQSFKKAKIFAKKSGITSSQEWKRQWKLGKIPNGFPGAPDGVYKNKGWKSWPDFLNSGWRTYGSFKSAKIFARKSRIKTYEQWRKQLKLGKIPRIFPSDPGGYYKKKGWKGWKDFLGTG